MFVTFGQDTLGNETFVGHPGPRGRGGVDRFGIGDADRYCYLLGVFLGEGTVCHRPPDVWSLQIINDRRNRRISAEVLAAMRATFPGSTPRLRASWASESEVLHVAHPAIPRAFPQHGPGRGHTRSTELAGWQRELTRAHPAALVRGLLHSDGCRSINRVRTTLLGGRVAEYQYVRYYFTNRSEDLRAIFIEHCELLGIRVTRPNGRNLSIAHRDSVAVLEEVAGPQW